VTSEKLIELANKADRLNRTARLQDLTLFFAQSEGERIQRIATVLEKVESGTYLIGTGPYTQGVYSAMADEVILGRLATPMEQPLDKPVDIFCHDVPCLMPREVSRYHAMIYRVGDASKTSIVKDLGSTCGTYVNGVRLGTVEGSDEPATKLSSGDVISLGPSHVNSYLFVELR
jgi:pSer/pThr/pTyr-binding forkhead associated (FHA) protein